MTPRIILDRSMGSSTNIPTASTTATAMDMLMTTFCRLSPNLSMSHLSSPDGSSSASSSSIKDVEISSAFIPNISESTKANIPLIKGILQIAYRSDMLRYSFLSTDMSPEGVRTPTAYSVSCFIMMPSITACPPIPLYTRFILYLPRKATRAGCPPAP